MTSFLERLANQRRKFLDGLDANEGDINLDIFEDFYPDRAHFLFELLQNAEDTEATEASFTLTRDGCTFDHNGKRSFTEANVRAITGIHNSTKTKTSDQIGKFGVGFKSVFVYSLTPTIHSGDFSFRISRLVLPEPVDHDFTIGSSTRFVFPFNNPKKKPDDAYAEVESGLNGLAETTLLFLSHLEAIRWKIDENLSGEVRRIQHAPDHFEVIKSVGRHTTVSSHFLKFDESVKGLDKQRIAVAFALDFLPNVARFDPKIALAKQMKIVPAAPGRVAVFFPAEKESSGLRFHLHAPFVPELSRASIKETPANQPLFEQLASLTAKSLHHIRDLDLLTLEFLSVLPNLQDQIPIRYQPVRTAIIDAMKTQPLTPTHAKSHAPARNLLQAKASLKDLLSEEDIELLIDYNEEPPRWAVGVGQKNSNADRFLAALEIQEWDMKEFVGLLSQKTSGGTRYIPSPPSWAIGPDPEFMNWLSGKPVDWHQKLYSLMFVELSPNGGCRRLKGLRIVRLSNGEYNAGDNCFFPSDGVQHDEVLPRVDENVYVSGRNKTQQENARKLLEEIGVREVREREQIEAILKKRYIAANFKPQKQDLKRFIALVEKDSTAAGLFAEYFVFEGKDGKWRKPGGIFLDVPFLETGLTAYHEALGSGSTRVALADSYNDSAIIKKLVKFAEAIGAQTRLEISQVTCNSNPHYAYLRAVSGERYTSPINRDYVIVGLENLLAKPTTAIAQLIWGTMCSLPRYSYCLNATYRKNESSGSRQADSQLVDHLKRAAWIPQGANLFVRPKDALRELLPEGFPYDPGSEWLKATGFGQEAVKKSEEQRQKEVHAKDAGFADNASFERAKRFAALPQEEQERILADLERKPVAELPDHEPTNPERRAKGVSEKAADAPDRRTEERTRSVSIALDQVKQEAAQYLSQQYTNADGEMICQVCKAALPFKLDDGSEYFEKTEFLTELKKRHYQNYLALCPNHGAMFQHANGSVATMQSLFVNLASNDLEIVLAQKDVTIYFTKTHIADLKEVIKVDGIDPEDAPGRI